MIASWCYCSFSHYGTQLVQLWIMKRNASAFSWRTMLFRTCHAKVVNMVQYLNNEYIKIPLWHFTVYDIRGNWVDASCDCHNARKLVASTFVRNLANAISFTLVCARYKHYLYVTIHVPILTYDSGNQFLCH